VSQEIWIAIYRALPRLLDASKFRPVGVSHRARPNLSRIPPAKLPLQPLDDAQLENLPEASNSPVALTARNFTAVCTRSRRNTAKPSCSASRGDEL